MDRSTTTTCAPVRAATVKLLGYNIQSIDPITL
jgi:hypothetical protein